MPRMRTLRLIALCCAFLGLAPLVLGQAKDGDKEKGDKDKPAKEKPEKKPPEVKVGDKMPAMKISDIVHPKFKSMAEVRGKLVLYEYFQHW
jgi:hypothetical protein